MDFTVQIDELAPAPAPAPIMAEAVPADAGTAAAAPPAVDPVRAAAGRLGGHRVHTLARLGREYEKEHRLQPGRQRLTQLIQLGKRYEAEHGRPAPAPRRKAGDPWAEFVAALARVVKPAHRPAVERLAAALRGGPAASDEGLAAGHGERRPGDVAGLGGRE